MASLQIARDFESENQSEGLKEAESASASVQSEHAEHKTESPTSSPPLGGKGDEPSLLMKELRRDSPESQQAFTGSDKPATRHISESDSSNPCVFSPSSSGHLADSDTLSSGEEGFAPVTEDINMEVANDPGQPAKKSTSTTTSGGRKSRRSHSESEMAAKKNRCQPVAYAVVGSERPFNGKLGKVKSHLSQKHKERIRLLRQKRELAARKKYNLLQDSSTSDSELTCDSSSTSTEDEDDDTTSGGTRSTRSDIPEKTTVESVFTIEDSDSECIFLASFPAKGKDTDQNTVNDMDQAADPEPISAQSSFSEKTTVESVFTIEDSDSECIFLASFPAKGKDTDQNTVNDMDQAADPEPISAQSSFSEKTTVESVFTIEDSDSECIFLASFPAKGKDTDQNTVNDMDQAADPEPISAQSSFSDGPPIVGQFDLSDTDSNPGFLNQENMRPSVIQTDLLDMAADSRCIGDLNSVSGHAEAEPLDDENLQEKAQINIVSSDSEVEIIEVQEKARSAHPCGGVIKTLSSWKEDTNPITTNNGSQIWTPPVFPTVSPPEVVDLTID